MPTEPKQNPKDTFYRTLSIDFSRANEAERSVEASLSSEAPYERSYGLEVLSHTPDAIDFTRAKQGLPLLWQHDPTNVLGIVENIKLSGGKLRGLLRFGHSQRAREVFADVAAGIQRNISVGYVIDDARTEKDGKQTRYVATRWQPLEVSLVSIAADPNVGIGRAYNSNQKDTEVITTMNEPLDTQKRGFTPSNDTAAAERERVVEIQALGKHLRCQDEAEQAIREGTSLASFKEWALTRSAKSPAPAFRPDIGMNAREVSDFSFRKLVLAAATNDWSQAGLEKEAVRATGPGNNGGFLIPHDVLAAPVQRAIGSTSSLSSVVPTQHMSGNFIEYLRDRTIIRNLGATVLSGLVGNVEVPRQTATATVGWVAENTAVSESILTTDNVELTPKTVGAYSDFTRRLMLQSDPTIESLIRRDLAGAVAVAIDHAAFYGPGGDAPMGILTVSGVPSVSLTTNDLTWAKVVELESVVAANNADVGSLAYATNALVRGFLKSLPKEDEIGAGFVWSDAPLDGNGFGTLNGYPAAVSNAVPSNLEPGANKSALIFGDFSSIILGEWSTIEVAVDPYALFTTGGIRVRVFSDLDVALRRLEAFAVIRDAATT